MDEETKELWLKALRSGSYEQGIGQLCEDGEYCCLGVLCSEMAKAGQLEAHGLVWTEHVSKNGPDEVVVRASLTSPEGLRCDTELPRQLAQHLSLDEISPIPGHVVGSTCDSLSHMETLILMNDRGTPFDEIADCIEENL